ncbi:MAG: hypothetical protein EOP84_25630 [Verrucomicrobiaceae bacterium]|nr:MAG: hypothetical protein EOP84_25630 [Verrucomicrobiaceae bacterium]
MKLGLRKALLFSAVTLFAVGAAFFGKFTSFFVCRGCGAFAEEAEWQVPFTSLGVVRQMRIESTPLSLLLETSKRRSSSHTHDWWLVYGTGNGIMCALGSGHDTLQAAESEDVARLIRTAHAAGQTEFADRLIGCTFQRETASGVWMLATETSLRGFPDAANFEVWLRENSKLIDESLKSDAKQQR